MVPKTYQLKTIAHALKLGIGLSYRGKLRDSKRAVLYGLLDDMAIALTREGVDEKNKRIRKLANILGELSDHIDIPLPK